MHAVDFALNLPRTDVGSSSTGSALPQPNILPGVPRAPHIYNVSIEFAPKQVVANQRKLGPIFQELNEKGEFHYGVEVLARAYSTDTAKLDFNNMQKFLPLFASIVWLGNIYAGQEPFETIEAIRMQEKMATRTFVVMHFSAYQLEPARLQHFLKLKNNMNMLAVRGDVVDNKQIYKHGSDLVEAVRKIKRDAISVGIAAYPDMHPESTNSSMDLKYLKIKVDAGSDYIVTQLCYSTDVIIDFIKKCRSNGIQVPILVGIVIPGKMQTVYILEKITKVKLNETEKDRIRKLDGKPEFLKYFINRAKTMIREIINANLGIYGFQFFTLNDFRGVSSVIEQLHKEGVIKISQNALKK